MTSRLRRLPNDTVIPEDHAAATPLCHVEACKYDGDDRPIYSVRVRLATVTSQAEPDDYAVALAAIADAIDDIRSGRARLDDAQLDS